MLLTPILVSRTKDSLCAFFPHWKAKILESHSVQSNHFYCFLLIFLMITHAFLWRTDHIKIWQKFKDFFIYIFPLYTYLIDTSFIHSEILITHWQFSGTFHFLCIAEFNMIKNIFCCMQHQIISILRFNNVLKIHIVLCICNYFVKF